MSDEIMLTVEERETLGKALKHMRKEGQVPAVIHNHGKESTHVVAPYVDMLKVYRQAGKHHPVSLTLGGKKHLTIIKDADFEPKKNMLRHVVFNSIRQDQPVEAEVPVEIIGDIPAEKASLMVITQLEAVMIEALPSNLPNVLQVSAEKLVEVGDRLHVSDIVLPNGVTLVTDPELAIAHVEMPKDQVAEANAAAEEQAAADKAASGEDEEEVPAPASGEDESTEDKPAES
jgi:large subunit ribosomal protein L25